jgi:hypothetical protein
MLLRPPLILVLIAQAPNQIGQMLRYALIDDVVVHGAQLLADPSLNFPAQTGFGLVGRRRWSRHFIRARRLFCDRLKIGLTVFHRVVFSPFAHNAVSTPSGTPINVR